ncbi:unnamed protein product, partial [Prorocentrum cordatum]
SMDELRHTMKEALFPRDESASQKALAEEVGAHRTPNMTNAAMKLEIRKAVLMKTKPEPTDFMGFGKHGALTCRQVRIQCPSYAEWAQKEASTDSSWELTQCVSWLNEMKVVQEMAKGPVEAPVEPTRARGGARSSRRRTMDVMMEDELGEETLRSAHQEELTANRQAQKEMLAALGQLNQRLERLEAPRAPSSADSCIAVEHSHTKMAEKFGEEAAQRVSSWSSHKLGAAQGNQKARGARDKAEPDHLWISTRKRRLQAIKEYKGAVQLVYDQVAQGGHAHWEWPIKCEGWGHALIRQMIEACSMTAVKVAGCQLGVKNEKGEPLLQEWLIATTSPKMAARMATECPGGRRHGELMGGGLTASTSYYTDEFAQRTARAMIEGAAPDYHELFRSMPAENETNEHAFAGQRESNSHAEDPGSKEYQKIMQWLTSVHRGSGHSSKDFHCGAREEANNHRPTHPPVSLAAIPPKWKQIQADQFEWEHPRTKLKAKFSLIVDENCKVGVTKLLYHMVGQDLHRNPVWADLKSFYEERWLPYFGKPQRVKVDPEGSWMYKQAAQYFDSDSIGYEPSPGQAHWRISLAEEAIQATKGTMDKLVTENPDMSTEEALARATAARISREGARGHSPLQRALGRAPDLDGHFFESDFDELPCVEAQRVDKEYGENYMRMCAAEQEYLRQVHLRRLSRAENAKNQLLKAVAPGMWVRYFRKETGEVKGRIIKVDVCQIRAASTREIACAELGAGKDTPWTANAFMNQAMRQVPEPAPPVKKARHEEPPSETKSERNQIPVRRAIRKNTPPPGGVASIAKAARAAQAEDITMERAALMAKASSDARSFWARQGTSLGISVELPPAGQPLKQATRRMSTYMAGQLKSGKREIAERTLALVEVAKFSVAKATEVNNYVISSALESMPPGATPPPEDVMRMRWILEWKMDETTSEKKPKARIVVLGYMDPEYEHRPTTAPTMTRTSRHPVLQAMAWLGFKGYKADVTVAFTQNREIKHDLFGMPVEELAVALGMLEGVAMRLRKAGYGLVEAAIEWFMTVGEALEEFGWTQMKMDPCVLALHGQSHGQDTSFTKEAMGLFTGSEVMGELIAAEGDLDIVAIAGPRVDDFLLGGKETDPRWIEARKKIEERFKWNVWETENFMQTVVRIRQLPDMSFKMDQSEHVKTIEKAVVSPGRKKNKDAPTTDKEKGQLRAILGAIGWRSEQSGPVHSAGASLLLSAMPSSTVQTPVDTNRLVDRVLEGADLPVGIYSHSSAQVIVPIEWSDSSEANRPDGKSTKGLVTEMAPLRIMQGDESDVSMISWKSGKIHRECRSSVSCETRSAVDGEDELFGVKLQGLEMLGNQIDWRNSEGTLSQLPAALVVDAKGLYDKLQTTVYTFRGKEKRIDVEAMTLKEGSAASNNWVLWAHGDAQLANFLTKGHEPGQLGMYYNSGHR